MMVAFDLTPILNQVYLHSLAPWPSGKARVCKTLISGPNPLGASHAKTFQVSKIWKVSFFISIFATGPAPAQRMRNSQSLMSLRRQPQRLAHQCVSMVRLLAQRSVA